MAPVLKTGRAQALVGSNPTPSALADVGCEIRDPRYQNVRCAMRDEITNHASHIADHVRVYPPQRRVAKLTESVAFRAPFVTRTVAVAFASSG